MMADYGDPYLIESAARILDVLELFQRSGDRLALSDVAERLSLPRSTTFRLLYTLTHKGFLERLPDSRFYRLRGRRQIGLATASSTITFAAEITRGIRRAAVLYNMDVLLAPNEFHGRGTLGNVEELLAAGVDLIMEINPDASLGHAIAERCRKARVPLLALAFPLPGAVNFAVNAYRAGFDGGQALAAEVGRRWRGEVDAVVLLNVPQAGPVQQARVTGMLDGLRQTVNVPPERVRAIAAARDSDHDGNLIYDALAQRPGKRAVILATNDTHALAAVRAAERFAEDRENLILSQGGVAPAREELQRPGSALWGTVGHFPERFGERVLPTALHMLAGERVPAFNTLPHAVLTSVNLRQYYPERAAMN